MVYPDSLHPTDDGRAAAETIVGRLNRDPNTVHNPGSYEWARARELEALDAQARHQADATWGSHPAGPDLVGADTPTQDQLARAERGRGPFRPLRAPISYYGGKSKMAPLIVSLIPDHDVYMEPFFGSGAVFFAKAPARHEIINDLEGNVVNFFRVLRDQPEQLERLCRLSPHARDEWGTSDIDDDQVDDLERARRYFVRLSQSFAQTAGPTTGWKITTARTQSVPATNQSRCNRFAACAERLIGVTIENCDAVHLLRLATPSTVIYVDPPYLESTRRSGRGTRYSDYIVDMGGDDEHRRLLSALRETPGSVILSGYPSPLYDELLRDWWSTDLEVNVHASNARTNSRAARTERLWCNFTPARPEQLTFPVGGAA
jgi:DNA adenine methylase